MAMVYLKGMFGPNARGVIKQNMHSKKLPPQLRRDTSQPKHELNMAGNMNRKNTTAGSTNEIMPL